MELFTLVLGALFVGQANPAGGSGAPGPTRAASATAPAFSRPAGSADRAWTANSNAAGAAAIPGDRFSGSGRRSPAASGAPALSGDKAAVPAGSSAPRRAVTSELVAKSFAVPPGGTLVGRPLTLLEALGASAGRSQQLDIIHAYWRLAAAVGEYRLQFDAAQRWRRLEPRADDVAALRTERSKTTEALRNAELKAQRAQQTLVEAAHLSPSAPPPLPSDPPHAGSYRTYFDEIFAMQNVPARARLVNRTLPLRRKGIDARATAVQAAEDAWEAAVDAYRDRTGDLAAVASCLARTAEQRAAMVRDVCQYNHEIADYALSVAAAHATPRALVAMLVLSGAEAEGASREIDNLASPHALPVKQSGVAPPWAADPAAWITPVPEGRPESGSGLPGMGQPTLAPPQPTLAPPRSSVLPAGPAPVPPKPVAEGDKAAPASWPSAKDGDRQPGGERREPGSRGLRVRPDRPGAAEKSGVAEKDLPKDAVKDPFSVPRMVQRPTGSETQGPAAASSPALYPALLSVSAGARVKHLSTALHRNRSLPQDAGRPTELEECLRGLSGTDRRSVIDAYWIARQRAAEYQVLVGQAELIEQIVPLALEHRRQPTGPLDMLRLRTARLACEADLAEAHADLLQSLFELTRRTGRALDGPWLVPTTAPHAGQYLLKLDAQRPEVVKQPAMQRLAAAVPALNDALREQAAAVVEADSVRAAATTAYQLNGRNIDQLLTTVRSQTVETFAFLQMLTAYNQTIAEYVLTVLPSAISGEQLVQTLVIIR